MLWWTVLMCRQVTRFGSRWNGRTVTRCCATCCRMNRVAGSNAMCVATVLLDTGRISMVEPDPKAFCGFPYSGKMGKAHTLSVLWAFCIQSVAQIKGTTL